VNGKVDMPETLCKPARQLKGPRKSAGGNAVFDFVIGAGANLGSPSENLARGLSLLAQLPELQIRALSRVYESDPVGPPQPRYLNAAVRVSSTLPALELLDRLLEIEVALGRIRVVRWGPRTLDLDLLWADQPVEHARLRVPHPHLNERSFALAPLLDVAPDLAVEYRPILERLGGAPELWGKLAFSANGVTCEHSELAVV
jgi:2-amino-4-hydroxy-6-hydroxymethyldihydropteridine diphosphokinase